MKTNHTLAKVISLLSMAAGLSLCSLNGGCAATPTSDSTGQFVDDTVITTKVKSALLGDDAVKSFAIKVETLKGVVQLSGFVDTADQKFIAGRDAGAVKGVQDVANNLIVK
jgi:osmotically-inducible protein OsmY